MLLAGCPGPAPEPEPEGPWAVDIEPLLLDLCGACHLGEDPEGETAFLDGGYDGVVGVPAEQADLALVEAGDSLGSYLWHKVNGSHSVAGGSGAGMPPEDPVDDDVLHTLTEWIDAGAPRL